MKPALLQFCGAICSSLFAAAAEAIGAKPICLGIATAPLRACGSPWFGLLVIEAVATIYVVGAFLLWAALELAGLLWRPQRWH